MSPPSPLESGRQPSPLLFHPPVRPARVSPSSRLRWRPLLYGGLVGYASSGAPLLAYLAAPGALTAVAAGTFSAGTFLLCAECVLALLLSLCCLFASGLLVGKRTHMRTSGWGAGVIAGLIQQGVGRILGQILLGVPLPGSFPLALLLWALLGGALGLLGASYTARRLHHQAQGRTVRARA